MMAIQIIVMQMSLWCGDDNVNVYDATTALHDVNDGDDNDDADANYCDDNDADGANYCDANVIVMRAEATPSHLVNSSLPGQWWW